MENKIDLTKSIYYIQLDLEPVPALRIFEKMDAEQNNLFENSWVTKDYLKNLNNNHRFLVVDDSVFDVFDESFYRQRQLDMLGIDKQEKDIPVYKMSDIENHYQGIDKKNSCACYFLEPGKDKKALDKVKSLGYDRITSLTNETISLKKKDVILIIKNDAYIHPNPDDDRFKDTCPEMVDLLAPTGKSNIQDIPRYKLNDFLNQEKEDIGGQNYDFLLDIPINRRTEAVCLEALNNHPSNMEDIPHYLFTDERIERILDMNYCFIADLPKEKLNEEICLNAIEKNSSVFLHMPQEAKTEKVCMAGYEQARQETYDPLYLGSIVEKIPHSNVLIDLLSKYNYCEEFDTILLSIPENVFDQKIAEAVVGFREHAIIDIPDKFISEKMAHTALEADINLMSSIPDRYKTFEMGMKAVFTPSEDEDLLLLLRSIPHPDLVIEVLFSKMYENTPAVHIAGNIPKEAINETVAEVLVRQNANCLPHIPFHLKNEDICLEAIRGTKTIDPLYAIPKDSMTNKVCTELVNKFPQAIAHILPEDKKSPEICLRAAINDDTLQRYVPEHIRDSKEMNIYRFGILAIRKLPELGFEKIKDLYEGKKVEVNHPDQSKGSSVHVQYNFQEKSLDYSEKSPDKKEKMPLNQIHNKDKGMKF